MAVPEQRLTSVTRQYRLPVPLPRTLDEMFTLAEIVLQSGLALGHRTKESVVLALQLGAELGFTPMQSLRSIAVIDGRPVPTADACVAAVTASAPCEYFREVETSDTHSTWETKRRGDAEARRFTFTMDDARRAGLTHRDTWQAYPKRMLAARAKKYLAQDTYPDIIGGLLSAEEAADLAQAPAPIDGGSGVAADAAAPLRITAAQREVLSGLLATGGIDAAQVVAWLRGRLPDVNTLGDLPATEYARVKMALENWSAKRNATCGGTHAAAD